MIARALIHEPRVIFLDEPTVGLDPQARLGALGILRELHAQGRTIVMTTHYMEEADQLCDRLAIIDQGKLLALDTPAALKARAPGGTLVELTLDGEPRPLRDAGARDRRRVERAKRSGTDAARLQRARRRDDRRARSTLGEAHGRAVRDIHLARAEPRDAVHLADRRKLDMTADVPTSHSAATRRRVFRRAAAPRHHRGARGAAVLSPAHDAAADPVHRRLRAAAAADGLHAAAPTRPRCCPAFSRVSLAFSSVQSVALPMVQDFGWTREIEDRLLAPVSTRARSRSRRSSSGVLQGFIAALFVLPVARADHGPDRRTDGHALRARDPHRAPRRHGVLGARAAHGIARESAADRTDVQRDRRADDLLRLRVLSVAEPVACSR